MKKKAFLRGLLGFPLGIALGHVISLIGSLFWGNNNFSPCVPSFVEQMGSEVLAVSMQTLLCGIMGTGFACASVIWEKDNWSIAKQTGLYFLITSLVMMPIAYITNWMKHSILGFLSYFGIFILIFIIIWVTQYFAWKNKIKKIKSKL